MKRQKLISCLLAGSMLFATGTMGLAALPKTMASADEISPAVEIYVKAPTWRGNRLDCAVQYSWKADSDCHLKLGTSWRNESWGQITTPAQEFYEIQIPTVGNRGTTPKYIWGVSVYNNDTSYESIQSRLTATEVSNRTITGSITSGNSRNYTLSLPSTIISGQKIYITVAYKGVAQNITYDTGDPLVYSNLDNNKGIATVEGLTFYVTISMDKTIRLSLSKSVTFSSCSNTINGCAAFAYSVE